ncbi:MAG TPA: hypothetical protein VKB59_02875 [Micromonosporaceae bacterium]|nr:hypothetical protein [Micromonosporaceae bacterium]
MHIEFTKLPDPDGDRRNLRAAIILLSRRRLWIGAVASAAGAVIGIGIMLTGGAALGAAIIVVSGIILTLVPQSIRIGTKLADQRLAKINSVPVLITITDIDVTFAGPWNYVSWAWAGIDVVSDLGSVLVARCGGMPVFKIPLDAMPPERVPELRAFLRQQGLHLWRGPAGVEIEQAGTSGT